MPRPGILSLSLSHTDHFINVTVIRISPRLHHRVGLSLAKCLVFMSGDEVIVAMVWLMLPDLSRCLDPPCLIYARRTPLRVSAQSRNELDSGRKHVGRRGYGCKYLVHLSF